MLFEGFILMVLTQIWKWLISKFGEEPARFIIHLILFEGYTPSKEQPQSETT